MFAVFPQLPAYRSFRMSRGRGGLRFPPYAPLTNPRNPLKRLFGAVGVGAFRREESFWFNSTKKEANSFALKLRGAAQAHAPPYLRPLYRGRKRSPCGDRYEVLAHFHYMYSALTEKILTTKIDKRKVWYCTSVGRGRRKENKLLRRSEAEAVSRLFAEVALFRRKKRNQFFLNC